VCVLFFMKRTTDIVHTLAHTCTINSTHAQTHTKYRLRRGLVVPLRMRRVEEWGWVIPGVFGPERLPRFLDEQRHIIQLRGQLKILQVCACLCVFMSMCRCMYQLCCEYRSVYVLGFAQENVHVLVYMCVCVHVQLDSCIYMMNLHTCVCVRICVCMYARMFMNV